MDQAAPKRPNTVTLTLWGVYLLGVWNFARALALSRQSALLQELAAQPDPALRLTLALLWSGLFWGLGEMLRRQRPSTRHLIPLSIVSYAAYELALLLFFAPAGPHWRALWFDLLLAGAGALFTAWALNRTAVMPYFTPQDTTTHDLATPINSHRSPGVAHSNAASNQATHTHIEEG